MDMLYKSDIIFHKESKKIGFAFFWCFFDFLRILQESAKSLILFKNHISHKPLEVFYSLQKSPCFADWPLERSWG
jgi:hypothetical protein